MNSEIKINILTLLCLSIPPMSKALLSYVGYASNVNTHNSTALGKRYTRNCKNASVVHENFAQSFY